MGWVKAGIVLALILGVIYGIHRFGDFEYASGNTAGMASVQKTFDAYQRQATADLLAANAKSLALQNQLAAASNAAAVQYEKGKSDAQAANSKRDADLLSGNSRLRIAITTATRALSSVKLPGAPADASGAPACPGANTATVSGPVAARLTDRYNASNELARSLNLCENTLRSERGLDVIPDATLIPAH
jgi:hypothetical protein